MLEEIQGFINQILDNNGLPKLKISKSSRPDLCDFQCNEVFKLAKSLQLSPIEIGTKIVNMIKETSNYTDYFNEVIFVSPGFINIKVSDNLINKTITKMNNEPKFNFKAPTQVETFVIDYGGYNIAKPLHIGHLRPTVIGESIKRIIEYKGHNTIGDVHLGDYGLQMGQVIYGIKRDGLSISQINIDYLNKIYPEISGLCKTDQKVLDECAKITKELQDSNPEYQSIWKKIYEVSLEDIKKTCDYLGTTFDTWEGESDAYPYLPEVEKILLSKKLLTESEGALVVDVKKDSDNKPMPPLMFKKGNGAYLYDSTDLGTILERKQKYNPNHIIYVVDNRQSLHFEQVFRTSDLAGILPYDSLEHDGNGTVNGSDGKPFKTRKGDAPKLRELFEMVKETFVSLKETNKSMSDKDLDIIVNAIVKFADLSNARDKDYIFDIEKFSQVIGKTGPYILYTYLRMNKIIKDVNIDTKEISNKVYNETDRNLRMKLIELESSFNQSFQERKPHYIAEYIYDLCVCANNFYQNNYISNLKDQQKLNDWIYILNLTNRVIKEMLNLLIIDIPSAM